MKDGLTRAGDWGRRVAKPGGRRRAAILWVVSLGCVFGGSPLVATAPSVVNRNLVAMGTHLGVKVVAADRETALHASEAAVRSVESTTDRLSTWRRGTELDRLNRSEAGTWHTVSPALLSDLEAARYWWRATGGSFDPGVGGLVKAWGLRGKGRLPSPEDLENARQSSGFALLALSKGRARREAPAFAVEEGGFGKGVALRDAAHAALEAGANCVELDLGGQLVILGECAVRQVEVADPRQRQRSVATIPLKDGSVATSGASERYIEVAGQKMGHILDPLTGQPVANWGSVTVIADDPVTADCCATALYVMGPERGLEWARHRSDIEAVFVQTVDDRIEIRSTSGVRERMVLRTSPH